MWPTPTDPPCTETDWPRLQAGAVDQPLPRGDEYKRQGSRLADRDIRRFEREQIGIDRREFRERAPVATDTPRHPVNLVTTAEARNGLTRSYMLAPVLAEFGRQAGGRARHRCERGRAPEAVLQQKLGRNAAGGADDEDSGVYWRRFPDLLALDQKAEWLERATGKRNL